MRAGAANTTTSTSAIAAIINSAFKTDGSIGTTSFAADENIFCIANYGSTKFLVKGNGDIYYDGADQGAYDVYEDALACQDLSMNLSGQLSKVLKYNKEKLHDMGVIEWTPETDDIFVSRKGMDMLNLGAIAELYRVTQKLCEKMGISYDEARVIQ